MSWEDIILEGLKPGNDFLTSLSKAREVAPPKIKKILIDFPISMNYTKKDIETLKRSRQGIILLLLYYFWLSICGEAFQIFPLDEQKRILEKGVKASTEASELASSINEKEIEAAYLYRAGRALYDLGKLQKAETTFRKALKEFSALAEKNPRVHDPHTASILNDLGLIYYDTKRFLRAEKAFKEALKKYRVLAQVNPRGYDHFTALTLNNLGALYSHAQAFEKSEKCHSKALKIYRRLSKSNPDYNPSLATTLSNLGSLYWNMKIFDKSEEFYREALTIRRRLADTNPDAYNPSLATTLSNVGALYSDIGKFSEAENVFKEALTLRRTLARKHPDAHIHYVAKTLDNLGNLYSKTDMFSEAEKALKEALTIKRTLAQKHPDRFNSEVALTLRNLGLLYYRAGKTVHAERAFNESLKKYRELARKNPAVYKIDVAGILNELGVFYNKIQRFSQAEKAFKEALNITEECAEKSDAYTDDVAMILNNLGALYWDATEFSKAEEVYKEALKMTRKLEEKNPDAYSHYVAAALNNLGNLYYDMDKFLKAEEVYTEALEKYRALAEKSPDVYKDGVADTLHNLGALYRKSCQFLKAEKASTEALTMMRSLARKNPDAYNPKVAMVLNNLGALYHEINNFSKAEKMYKEALKITEKEELWFSLAATYHNISTLSNNKSEEAIHILELGILFSGEKKYKYAQKGRRESIYLRFLKYVDDPQRMVGILEALRDPDLLSLQWDLTQIQKARKNKNLQKKMVKNLRKISPLSIPFQIPDNVLFLYMQKMKDDILYVVVTKEGTRTFRSTPEFFDYGEKLVVNLRVQMLGALYCKDLCDIATKFDRISKRWVHALPTEIQEFLCEKDTIVFSPDAALSYFPLEGLVIDGEPICLSKKVVRATSIHQLHEITSNPLVIDSSLIVGNPWPSTDEDSVIYSRPSTVGPIRYLENAEKEAQALAGYLPNPKTLLNVLATADTFLKEVSNYSLIHFAGHGYLGRILIFSGPMTRVPPEFEPEEFSQLRKAWRSVNGKTKYMMDEWDFITDIDILETPLKKGAFVFLSACETGKHKYAGGGHFQGLAQAFLKSGASNVISSLISLYDEPSRDFALSFYRNLSHKSVSTALQDTRKIMKKKYKAHIYWLPYIHYGSPLEPDSAV